MWGSFFYINWYSIFMVRFRLVGMLVVGFWKIMLVGMFFVRFLRVVFFFSRWWVNYVSIMYWRLVFVLGGIDFWNMGWRCVIVMWFIMVWVCIRYLRNG